MESHFLLIFPVNFFVGTVAEQQKRSGHHFEGKPYERHDAKSNKVCLFFYLKFYVSLTCVHLHLDGLPV